MVIQKVIYFKQGLIYLKQLNLFISCDVGSAPHSVVPDLHTYDFSTEARAELTLAFMKALNINK